MKVYFALILSMLVSMAVTSSLRKKFHLAERDSEHTREHQEDFGNKMTKSDDTKVSLTETSSCKIKMRNSPRSKCVLNQSRRQF